MPNAEIEKLKTGYWGNLTTNSFLEKNGNRLFTLNGLFSKKFYIIDSDETEVLLRKKLIKQNKIVLGSIIGVSVVFNSYFLAQWLVFVCFLLFAYILQRIISKIIFDKTLSHLKTLNADISYIEMIRNFSRKSSVGKLWAGFLGSLVFVICGLFLLNLDKSFKGVYLVCLLFFGLCFIAWGYALFIKMGDKNNDSVS